jgi:5-methyltetrahydrofolate--homocysteine methyltransferase
MADYARKAYAAGARIVGACCGSTPAHIQAIAAALASEAAAA